MIKPKSMSLTSGLKPPWAKLPIAYAATSRSPSATRYALTASANVVSAAKSAGETIHGARELS